MRTGDNVRKVCLARACIPDKILITRRNQKLLYIFLMSQLHRPGGHPKHSFTSLKYLTSDFESYSAPYVADKK